MVQLLIFTKAPVQNFLRNPRANGGPLDVPLWTPVCTGVSVCCYHGCRGDVFQIGSLRDKKVQDMILDTLPLNFACEFLLDLT